MYLAKVTVFLRGAYQEPTKVLNASASAFGVGCLHTAEHRPFPNVASIAPSVLGCSAGLGHEILNIYALL